MGEGVTMMAPNAEGRERIEAFGRGGLTIHAGGCSSEGMTIAAATIVGVTRTATGVTTACGVPPVLARASSAFLTAASLILCCSLDSGLSSKGAIGGSAESTTATGTGGTTIDRAAARLCASKASFESGFASIVAGSTMTGEMIATFLPSFAAARD